MVKKNPFIKLRNNYRDAPVRITWGTPMGGMRESYEEGKYTYRAMNLALFPASFIQDTSKHRTRRFCVQWHPKMAHVLSPPSKSKPRGSCNGVFAHNNEITNVLECGTCQIATMPSTHPRERERGREGGPTPNYVGSECPICPRLRPRPNWGRSETSGDATLPRAFNEEGSYECSDATLQTNPAGLQSSIQKAFCCGTAVSATTNPINQNKWR